jgi:hypothetical protein
MNKENVHNEADLKKYIFKNISPHVWIHCVSIDEIVHSDGILTIRLDIIFSKCKYGEIAHHLSKIGLKPYNKCRVTKPDFAHGENYTLVGTRVNVDDWPGLGYTFFMKELEG